jgi:dCTP deaminase
VELLNKQEIEASLNSADADSLFIDPLLDKEQVGAVTVDLRLGCDFLVSILTRKPSIDIGQMEGERRRGIASYFQETRRELGEMFVLYPSQVVLATTLEYVSLPSNVYADVLSRSSYTRIGIHINTMIQPGFRGCFPLELFNHGNNAVQLVVGTRICQSRFFRTREASSYFGTARPRKYYGDVRPVVSKADSDEEITRLRRGISLLDS